MEESFVQKKIDWFNTQNKEWDKNTPFIYDRHKDADKKLQRPKDNQTFVSIKRVPPKLPNIKDLVIPFMTEAIDETMLEEQATSQLKESSYVNANKYPERMEQMNADNYFKFKDPNPMAYNRNDLVEIQPPTSKSKREKSEEPSA